MLPPLWTPCWNIPASPPFSLSLNPASLFRGEEVSRWLESLLAAKKLPAAVSFRKLYRQTGRHLSLVALDTTGKELLVLNHLTAPDCPVIPATRMSLSFPFVWEEVVWQDDFGTYRGRSKTGHRILDGGVLMNFPLRLLLEKSQQAEALMGPPSPRKDVHNIGLYLDDQRAIPGIEAGSSLLEDVPLYRTVSGLVETITDTWDQQVNEVFQDQICTIGARGIGALELDIDDVRLLMLVNSGACAMIEHLKKRGLAVK